MGSIEPTCGISLLLNPSPSRCPSRSIGLGGPLASPRRRFCGFGLRLELSKKGQDVPVRFWAGSSKAVGTHLGFSPLALFDVRRPWALRGSAFEPRSIAAHIEWGDYRFVTRHEALRCSNCICNAWMYGMNVRFNSKFECKIETSTSIAASLHAYDTWKISLHFFRNQVLRKDNHKKFVFHNTCFTIYSTIKNLISQ